jgi:hypothetical protein
MRGPAESFEVIVLPRSAFPASAFPAPALPIRMFVGLGAGLASMGFVLASALTAPDPERATAHSTCPMKDEDAALELDLAGGLQAPATVKAAP